MGISIDSTFVIQIVSFLVLWAVLKALLFDPVLRVLHQREARTRGSLEAAEQLRTQASAFQTEHATSIREVRREVFEQADESRKASTAEERKAVTAARDAAATAITRVRSDIEIQIREARALLSREAAELAQQAADKVLGRKTA